MPRAGSGYNDYMREYMLRRYHQRRSLAIRLLGGECVDCGSTKNLQFDHDDTNKKSFSVSKLWSVSTKRFHEEIEKCVLRCSSCHRKKTLKERKPMTHGRSYAAMTRGCRCEECLVFRKQFNATRRKKRGALR